MSGFFKLFGFAALLLAALLLGRAYSAFCKRRTIETESFYLLINHIKEEITLFLSTPKKFFSGYEDKALEDSGFLPCARDGDSMGVAFEKACDKLALGERTKKRLALFFSEFGKNYKDGEIKRCELFEGEIEKILAVEREEEGKRIKLAYTLLFSSALAVIILLI